MVVKEGAITLFALKVWKVLIEVAGTAKLKGSSWIKFNRTVWIARLFFSFQERFFPTPQLNSSKHSQAGFAASGFLSLTFFFSSPPYIHT